MISGYNLIEVKDGNPIGRSLYERHYSHYTYKDGRKPKLFVGPGEKLVLINPMGTVLIAFRKFISKAPFSDGVNCAIFRNESDILSSDLLLEAEQIAWRKWHRERLYTYVNPTMVKSTNPGYCFKMAGWSICGTTKIHNLIIFEKFPGGVVGTGIVLRDDCTA